MRKIILLLFVVVFVITIIGCSKKNETASTDTKDKTEKAEEKKEVKDVAFDENGKYHLKYEYNIGNEEKYTMDMYAKGKTMRIETEMGKKGTSLNIIKGDILYMVTDMDGQKFGMKMNIKDSKKTKNEDMSDIVRDIKDKIKDYEKTGTEEILGYNKCNVYKAPNNTTFSLYKDMVALRVKGDKFEMVAKEFDPSASIGDEMFEPPKDVEYMDMNNLDMGKMKELMKNVK